MGADTQHIIQILSGINELPEAEKTALLKAAKNIEKATSILEFKVSRADKEKKTLSILLEETIEELEKKRKAVEAQNRELEVEAALERVRSRAMAMHKTDDLHAAVTIMFEEFQNLHMNVKRCGVGILNKHSRTGTVWVTSMSDNNMSLQISANESFDTHPFMRLIYDSWQNQEDLNYILEGQELISYYETMDASELNLPKSQVNFSENHLHTQYYYAAMFTAGGLYAFKDNPFAPEDIKLMKRFAAVVSLTYNRFLDLQKAEAQAREAQIELALERVRARTMAMQKSEELAETSFVLFQQFQALGETSEQISIGIFNEVENIMELYSTLYGSQWKEAAKVSLDEPVVIRKIYAAWKDQKKSMVIDLTGEELSEYNAYRKKLSSIDYKEDRWVIHIAFFSKGVLTFSVTEPHPDETIQLLERFANVFEQTYTRFLDLKNAEAQAREADIQLALERVRARTMAMQKSEELPEAANVLFQQIHSLGMPAFAAGYCIWDYDKQAITLWMSTEGVLQPPFKAPTTEDELFIEMRNGYEKGKSLHVIEMGGEELVAHYQYMRTLPVVGDFFDSILEAGHSFPIFQVMHQAYFSKGFLLFITYEQVTEAHDIFKRFANVFEQTYTRFLDLKTAEAQARESQIEIAVERVRAKALSMQKSENLHEVVVTLKNELMGLSIPGVSAVSMYLEQDDGSIRALDLSGMKDGEQGSAFKMDKVFRLEETDPDLWIRRIWNGTENYFVVEADEADFERIIKWLYTIDEKDAIVAEKIIKEEGIQKAWLPTVKLDKGRLNIDLLQPPTPEIETILVKIGAAFDLAYKRFLDLQKAEAQAREAQIEAALERVRAKAMAMHKSEDVNAAVGIVFEELDKLNLGILRCGIAILTKEKRSADVWSTTKSDKGLIVQISGDESIDIHPMLEGAFAAWINHEEDYSYDLYGDDLIKYYKSLSTTNFNLPEELHRISSDVMPEQHFFVATFSAGCLFAFRQTPYPKETKRLMKRFAGVFNLTYKRYLDLQKAEAQAKEAKIEVALEKVRSRTMGMQRSVELGDVATILFKEMNQLVENLWTCGFVLCEKDRGEDEWWLSTGDGFIPAFYLPNTGDATHANIYDAWKKGETYHTEQLDGDALQEHYDWLMKIPVSKNIFDEMMAAGNSLPASQKLHCAYFSYGYLVMITQVPCAEEQIFKRFAQVFDQTYTRFLDLQKAEAQTRQAKIETALEKVRARSLAMQLPEELIEVAEVLRHEMGLLGIEELETCSIYIHDETINRTECWYALKDIRAEEKKLVSDHFPLNLHDTWVGREMEKFYRTNAKQVSIVMKGVHRKEWINYCEEKSIPFRGYYGAVIPDRTYHLYKFSHGAIGAASAGAISAESWDLLKRAASVFSLAYSRFKDLTKARFDLQLLKEEKQRAETALSELQTTQKQLIQSEKMASLGELTAGIAHEIQNPLNFVNNFSEVNKELLFEMKEEIEKGNFEEVKALANDLIDNQQKINHHGNRADAIVKGMLQHSRRGSDKKEPTEINALADEYLRLSYHGLRAKDTSFNADFKTNFDETIGKINVMPQDVGRVLLNLYNNAFYAVSEKKKQNIETYNPLVSISTKKVNDSVEITVNDNGNGIPHQVLNKIFQPFFTTKPTGQGTGLGLSISYDIIKAHGGELLVETKEGEFSEFIILLPLNN